ncbi:MAG: periplasmic binding protein, partial [Candidatus Krumholzibacteriota bacterium]|nr:periplasmic binding protein [Candidatus Krumholzibacteriota bacterium]
SLVPSITETLIELGAGNRVVGITNYCIHPARAVDNIPRVGGTKGASLEKIDALRPDLVIANREENRRRHIDALREKYPVYVTYPRTVEQALKLIGDLGALTRTAGKAAEITETCKQIVASTEPAVLDSVFSTACLVWRDPWMAVGADTYISDLLGTFGFKNVFTRDDGRYPEVSLGTIAERGTDVVVLPNEPYAFAEPDRRQIGATLAENGRRARVLVVDGSYLTWFGYRTIQGLRFLRYAKTKLLSENQ